MLGCCFPGNPEEIGKVKMRIEKCKLRMAINEIILQFSFYNSQFSIDCNAQCRPVAWAGLKTTQIPRPEPEELELTR